ncbi:hypothetical protein RDWZM_003465 [Blomia tropicalis]|uniref:Uncharacterized protein n=1 Tax=Blomia tropicalis TaxID=40697 RepID=A0A9Q0RSP8_BLOTA|nr:hypothetical protein RDWZM_003465 [Blomia tropicalis]
MGAQCTAFEQKSGSGSKKSRPIIPVNLEACYVPLPSEEEKKQMQLLSNSSGELFVKRNPTTISRIEEEKKLEEKNIAKFRNSVSTSKRKADNKESSKNNKSKQKSKVDKTEKSNSVNSKQTKAAKKKKVSNKGNKKVSITAKKETKKSSIKEQYSKFFSMFKSNPEVEKSKLDRSKSEKKLNKSKSNEEMKKRTKSKNKLNESKTNLDVEGKKNESDKKETNSIQKADSDDIISFDSDPDL